MFKNILIANRGEIACRIMRTAQRMGIATTAVYSDADANAAHVALADRAVRIGPPAPRESYLNIGAILDAARSAGADAIHPGYGFLSENAGFAEACTSAGVTFIGPPASAIRAMGLKDRAKALMAKAAVPIVPGYLGDDQSTEQLALEAARIGFPVLIKAVAGGGGKGMRRVDAAETFVAALASAKREAQAAFGDDKVLIEKYVARPRHIEVQVFADRHGGVIHLFERDCSLQRRHQKVIEEAPAPGMSPALRTSIGEAAVRAAKAVDYVGAGTIEFIADTSDGLRADRIWFMEMNTRLQVEHPVTEAITGTDLVEWQIRVAAGEPLPKKQDELKIDGHAIEVRLYAEDPQRGFLPSTGTLERLRFSHGVRVDTGVREGDTVTPFYDPMIAKVIAHDTSREQAATRLASALEETQIAGLQTNNAFLIRALRDPEFVRGDIDTGFIEKRLGKLLPPTAPPARALQAAAQLILSEGAQGDSSDPWNAHDGFRLGARTRPKLEFIVDRKRTLVEIAEGPVTEVALRLRSGQIAVMDRGETFVVQPYDPFAAADAAGAATDRIVTPMPGKVIQLFVKAGDAVRRGQPLAVLEAMKMEHTLAAPADETVESVSVSPGDQVAEGTVVIRFARTGAT
ncbi:MAG TPA: acetyl/propionyl/methylcrotonyl-CoA carboxylase subunit alpha [Rhizomicrobium sp.]|nr:acetyl/propionyl/methylcrotonyl-CoA carboxylase subunit alpha [Rhizomicrobium sp.]